jgi:hypothetical protein
MLPELIGAQKGAICKQTISAKIGQLLEVFKVARRPHIWCEFVLIPALNGLTLQLVGSHAKNYLPEF